jgi:ankyrin repeat protein
LLVAARKGRKEVVKILLSWPQHAPRADVQNGAALIVASQKGHIGIVKTLLDWPEHAPSSELRAGLALRVAAKNGHVEIVTLLLERRYSISSDYWVDIAELGVRD